MKVTVELELTPPRSCSLDLDDVERVLPDIIARGLIDYVGENLGAHLIDSIEVGEIEGEP